MRRFIIKLTNWEYWPQWVVYMPLGIYYLYLAARARSFFFFSATNPGIETGGMFFESKWDVLQIIPQHLYPSTILVKEHHTTEQIKANMALCGLCYPLIGKPDRGERGWGVQKINNEDELEKYREKTKISFLIQQYVDYPVELSVFYIRRPGAEKGSVSSITYKKLLSVTGDGHSSLKELILASDRAYLQKRVLFDEYAAVLETVIEKGKEFNLVPYGNHVRGAEFRDYTSIVDKSLTETFDKMCRDMSGFFYGRFDLRVKSIESLKQGKDVAILELNGTGAEPAHIYDPRYKFITAQRDLFWHYRQMYEIAMYNKANGARFMRAYEYFNLKAKEKEYKRKVA